jgi:hypothetical protein
MFEERIAQAKRQAIASVECIDARTPKRARVMAAIQA